MRLSAVTAGCIALLALPVSADTAPPRVSGPTVHENLAVYFIHGRSQDGPVPLTLEEALRKGSVQVRETSNVNALEIKNLGDKPVFVQAGDIVKGGKQDRTLTVSLLLPAKSGRVSIASFCVEHGRWSPRASENAGNFASSSAIVPSREMKLAMQAPLPAVPGNSPRAETGERQAKVWDSVSRTQAQLTKGTGADVRAVASASSLQLALENEKLIAVRDAYVKALKTAGEKGNDIVGFVFAVNGKLNSGDVYLSHALFRKMWPKLLQASAIEAIGRRNETVEGTPSEKEVREFLAKADNGNASEWPLEFGMRRVLNETESGYRIEAASAQGWVHRSYLVK